MNDLDVFTFIFNNAGVGYELIEAKDSQHPTRAQILTFTAKKHKKVNGYTGFYTNMLFDSEGTLIEVEIWG